MKQQSQTYSQTEEEEESSFTVRHICKVYKCPFNNTFKVEYKYLSGCADLSAGWMQNRFVPHKKMGCTTFAVDMTFNISEVLSK